MARRSPHWTEEQNHKTLGQEGNQAIGTPRPAPIMGLYLWRHMPGKGQGCRPDHALLRYKGMNQHLGEISQEVDPGAHAVLILDQAGWHSTPKLIIPDNITLLFLPPRSPELNPVENIWRFMRDNWLSSRVFDPHEDIVARSCEAWNKLLDHPWRIMSIGMREWAHG